MLKLLKNILNSQNSEEDNNNSKDLELLCGLMIEAAYTDGKLDTSELNKKINKTINKDKIKKDPNSPFAILEKLL